MKSPRTGVQRAFGPLAGAQSPPPFPLLKPRQKLTYLL